MAVPSLVYNTTATATVTATAITTTYNHQLPPLLLRLPRATTIIVGKTC